jgi:hypothetical protein
MKRVHSRAPVCTATPTTTVPSLHLHHLVTLRRLVQLVAAPQQSSSAGQPAEPPSDAQLSTHEHRQQSVTTGNRQRGFISADVVYETDAHVHVQGWRRQHLSRRRRPLNRQLTRRRRGCCRPPERLQRARRRWWHTASQLMRERAPHPASACSTAARETSARCSNPRRPS